MEQFTAKHTPYRKRFLTQYEHETLFGTELAWMSKDSYLDNTLIDQALQGIINISCLVGTSTKVLGIDIDDHRGYGEAYLLNLYEQVCNKVGLLPSLLSRSPRGLHAYWYMEQYLPTEILVNVAREQLKGIPCK